MTIDPRRLLHFLAVVRVGTISKAARQLRLSQPALSNSIAALERSLGTRLLERSRRGVAPTELGELLSRRAEVFEAFLQGAGEELDRHKRGLNGRISIGVSPVAAVTLVPRGIARLAAEYPDASIGITELPDDQLLDGLLKGVLDIVICPTGLHRPSKRLTCEHLFTDRFVVAVSATSPLARRKSIALSQIADLQFAMPQPGTSMHRSIEALFSAAGVPWPSRCLSTNSLLLIKRLLVDGDAVTIISDRLVEPEIAAGSISSIPLRDARSGRDVSIWRLRGSPPQVLRDRLVDHLRALCSEEAGSTGALQARR